MKTKHAYVHAVENDFVCVLELDFLDCYFFMEKHRIQGISVSLATLKGLKAFNQLMLIVF